MKRFAKRTATFLWLASAVLVAFAVLLPTMLGMQRYVIVGDSMTGTIAKGSLVYAHAVPVAELRTGDIVTFVPPGFAEPVTHRIIGITTDKSGASVFRTKGDFNEAADPWRLTFVDAEVARYSFHVPYLGYLMAALATQQVRMWAIALPALVIALSLLWSMWRAAGEELRRRESAHAQGVCDALVAEAEADA